MCIGIFKGPIVRKFAIKKCKKANMILEVECHEFFYTLCIFFLCAAVYYLSKGFKTLEVFWGS